jgi:DNA-binding Lrp family transcriptional regulator
MAPTSPTVRVRTTVPSSISEVAGARYRRAGTGVKAGRQDSDFGLPLWSGGNGRMIGYRGVRVIVRAFVLIQTESGKTGRVAQEVGAIQGVSSAVVVTGPYDIIAVVQAASIDALGKVVVSRIQGVKGISRTLTCPVVHI